MEDDVLDASALAEITLVSSNTINSGVPLRATQGTGGVKMGGSMHALIAGNVR